MARTLSFYPVGNGDMALVELESGRKLLFDLNIRAAAHTFSTISERTLTMSGALSEAICGSEVRRTWIRRTTSAGALPPNRSHRTRPRSLRPHPASKHARRSGPRVARWIRISVIRFRGPLTLLASRAAASACRGYPSRAVPAGGQTMPNSFAAIARMGDEAALGIHGRLLSCAPSGRQLCAGVVIPVIHGSRAPDRIPGSAIFASGVEDPRLALRLGRTARALHEEAREWSGKSCSRSEAEWQAEKGRASAPVARETP